MNTDTGERVALSPATLHRLVREGWPTQQQADGTLAVQLPPDVAARALAQEASAVAGAARTAAKAARKAQRQAARASRDRPSRRQRKRGAARG